MKFELEIVLAESKETHLLANLAYVKSEVYYVCLRIYLNNFRQMKIIQITLMSQVIIFKENVKEHKPGSCFRSDSFLF